MGKIYFGTYRRSLDEKGRLLLPAKFGLEKGETLFVMRGFDGCVSLYEAEEFVKLTEKLGSMDYRNEEDRAYIRECMATSMEMKLDAHGRVLLGKELLEEYAIGSDITLLGVLDHMEVWDSTCYASYRLQKGLGFSTHNPRRS